MPPAQRAPGRRLVRERTQHDLSGDEAPHASESAGGDARAARDGTKLILRGVFDDRFEDEAHAIAVYEAHNARVKREFPRERLLVYLPGQGWEPLCWFLGVAVPATPYPRVNTTEEFVARFKR